MMRRLRKIVAGLLAIFGAVSLCLLIGLTISMVASGCAGNPPINAHVNKDDPNRLYRLMMLAQEEAGTIDAPKERLTRQLNIAEMQIDAGRKSEASKSLAAATGTLTGDSAKLDSFVLLSGWVSVSELSRRAGDRPSAEHACDEAVKSLLALQDEAERCRYVLGIAAEIYELRGPAAAVNQLDQSAPWTDKIKDTPERRRAVSGFASALFNLDAFSQGKAMIGRDKDAIWRTDTLTAMARPDIARESSWRKSAPAYGVQMDYQSNFKARSQKGD